MESTNNEIDIILTWVDGNDPTWRARYEKYAPIVKDGDKRVIRFRDWELLHYWFRSIETFAPWVRKIHFITSGEKPEWLNTDHPKLNWVKHEDFIPEEYLPTFNINTIETNFHRIKDLAEQFIFFNDDMFLTNNVTPDFFFKNGLPCDFAVLDPIFPEAYPEIYVNAILILNRHFDKKKVMKQHWKKWYNIKYGKYLPKTILLSPWIKFPGMLGAHLPQPFKKATYIEVWEAEPEILHQTGLAKFRSHTNVNQWLFKFWNLAKGEFIPSRILQTGQSYDILDETIDEICSVISNRTHKQICINDMVEIEDFEQFKSRIQEAFEKNLPTKSSFEL